jgi:hypothetical protein
MDDPAAEEAVTLEEPVMRAELEAPELLMLDEPSEDEALATDDDVDADDVEEPREEVDPVTETPPLCELPGADVLEGTPLVAPPLLVPPDEDADKDEDAALPEEVLDVSPPPPEQPNRHSDTLAMTKLQERRDMGAPNGLEGDNGCS